MITQAAGVLGREQFGSRNGLRSDFGSSARCSLLLVEPDEMVILGVHFLFHNDFIPIIISLTRLQQLYRADMYGIDLRDAR